LRNLYAGQEATVRTGHGTTDWFQIGKGVGLLLTTESGRNTFIYFSFVITWSFRDNECVYRAELMKNL